MKKVLFFVALVMAAISANAQWFAGGNVNVDLRRGYNALTFSPDFGYAWEECPLSVGLSLASDFYQDKELGELFALSSICVAPFVRCTYLSLDRFDLFLELDTDFTLFDGFSWDDIGFSPGVSFMLTEHWSAEFMIGFIGYYNSDDRNRGFGANMDLSTSSFGIYYNF